MAKGGIVINNALCKGCGLCIINCKRGCLGFSKDEKSSFGTPVAAFENPDKCIACCVCAWMCPDFAIDVYKFVEEESS